MASLVLAVFAIPVLFLAALWTVAYVAISQR